ncbi:flagellar FliJ family protein [bacterium]|nr:flagellar FliJ family protein [bacterium]
MELRKWKERFSHQKLAEAQRNRTVARRDLRKTLDEVTQQDSIIRRQVSGVFKVGDALAGSNYKQRLQSEMIEKEQQVQRCDDVVEQRTVEVIEASRDRQAMETLKKRKLEEYTVDANRREQVSMDDDASRRHHYNHLENDNNGK